MRLFVAVWPPDHVLATVATVVDDLRRRAAGAAAGGPDKLLRWTAPAQWHVTLRFLGRADEAVAVSAFRSIEPGEVPARAALGPATGRFGRRVLHVPVHGLAGLAAATAAATAGVGEPPEDRPFAGHLTLARARARGGADLSVLSAVAVPAAAWEVSSLSLVASVPGRGGASYEVVAALPLGAR